ncbi:excalibur calcium-binding domain-containing protein [Rhodococcus aetherivorans]|uniref:excalibur calcium-binding domain-containing protein n=1 Tax=Rhodococcus aetherivorans TaxID=191292 RepID=UPI003680ED32
MVRRVADPTSPGTTNHPVIAPLPTTTVAPAPVYTTPAPVYTPPAYTPSAPVYTPPPAYTPPAVQASASVYYKNCDAARAAGAAPIYAGKPGYASKLDRDNDGVACE